MFKKPVEEKKEEEKKAPKAPKVPKESDKIKKELETVDLGSIKSGED